MKLLLVLLRMIGFSRLNQDCKHLTKKRTNLSAQKKYHFQKKIKKTISVRVNNFLNHMIWFKTVLNTSKHLLEIG